MPACLHTHNLQLLNTLIVKLSVYFIINLYLVDVSAL
jgi:hypothetical protein